MRSVFVSQLAARVGDRELRIFFETNAGPVREARVIVDRVSRRSKGYVAASHFNGIGPNPLTVSDTSSLKISILSRKHWVSRTPGC